MTISKGAQWGRPGVLAPGGQLVHSDAEARRILLAHRARAGSETVVLGLLGGDLCRTVGGTGDIGRLTSNEAMHLPIDIVRVRIDDAEPTWFVAHLVARGRAWHGPFLVALNAEWLGRWKAGPRAHPNDGLVDLIHGQLGWRDRVRANRRARSGSHLPHPALQNERVAETTFRFARPRRLWLDGEAKGWATKIDLVVEPDALVCVV